MVLLLSCMTAPEEDSAPTCSGDVALVLAHLVEGEWARWPGYLRLTTWNTEPVVDVSLQLGDAAPRHWQLEQPPTDDSTSTTCERWTVFVDSGEC